jgi:hypothetical protein
MVPALLLLTTLIHAEPNPTSPAREPSQNPRSAQVLVPGGLSLAAGIVGSAVSLLLGGASATVLAVTGLRHLNWETGSVQLEEETSWQDADFSVWPILWNWATVGVIASLTLASLSLLVGGIGAGMLAAGLTGQE